MKILHHSLGDLLARGAMSELVRRGKQEALEILAVWRDIRNHGCVLRGCQKVFLAANSLVVQLGRDIKHGPAFWDGDGVNENSALSDLPKNLRRGYRVVEIIFTRMRESGTEPQSR